MNSRPFQYSFHWHSRIKRNAKKIWSIFHVIRILLFANYLIFKCEQVYEIEKFVKVRFVLISHRDKINCHCFAKLSSGKERTNQKASIFPFDQPDVAI